MTLGSWELEASPDAIFRFRVWLLPVTWCLVVFRMGFVQNRRFSIVSHWLTMEMSQNWPDLRSPISIFWDIHFIGTVTYINRWKFQGNRSVGVVLMIIQTFYDLRSLDVTWWPDLAWPGSEIFTTFAKKMYDKLCRKRTVFWGGYLEKTEGCLNNNNNTPPPHQGEG